MKSRRILLVRNSWGFGGAENYVFMLSDRLKDKGYEVFVITNQSRLKAKCEKIGVKTINAFWYKKQGWGRAYYFMAPLSKIWYGYIMKKFKISLVHAQGRDDFIFATAAAKKLNIKVVWTDHADLKYILERHNSPNLVNSILDSAEYAARVIMVSESEKNEVLNRFPDFPNIEVIHNGVVVPKKINKIKKPKKIIIGSTNRLVEAKGIADLIKGYSKLNNIEKTELWLVGEGEDRKYFEELSKKLSISKYVKFLGHRSDVWRYLGAFDIFVQSTYHEAFSISLVEASASGCAVIATNVGGNPEIINNKNGILIPPKDANAITSAINRYIENPQLMKEYSTKLKKLALDQFDFDKIVEEKVIPIYEN